MPARPARTLAELRRERGLSQRALARRLGLTQAQVSRTEHQPDPQLSTLASYLEALGDRLELTAIHDGQPVPLRLDPPTRTSKRAAPAHLPHHGKHAGFSG